MVSSRDDSTLFELACQRPYDSRFVELLLSDISDALPQEKC